MNEPSNFVNGSIEGCPKSPLNTPPFIPGICRLHHGDVIYLNSTQLLCIPTITCYIPPSRRYPFPWQWFIREDALYDSQSECLRPLQRSQPLRLHRGSCNHEVSIKPLYIRQTLITPPLPSPPLRALEKVLKSRSLVISRSTYPGSGTHCGHWLGDNASKWRHMANSIPGQLSSHMTVMQCVT